MRVRIVGDDYVLSLPRSRFMAMKDSFDEFSLRHGTGLGIIGSSQEEAREFGLELTRLIESAAQKTRVSEGSRPKGGTSIEAVGSDLVLTTSRRRFRLLVDVYNEYLLSCWARGCPCEEEQAFVSDLARLVGEALRVQAGREEASKRWTEP